MNKFINVKVENNLYFETICYIEVDDNIIDNDLYSSLTLEEQTILNKMRTDKLFSHSEFIVHSKIKDFESVLDFILNLDIKEYLYFCNHESYPINHFDNVNVYEWNQTRKTAVEIIKKVSRFLKRKININTYSEKISSIHSYFKETSPLNVSQHILGKKFKRVSDYKNYYFIPLHYLSNPWRIFNDDELWTLVPLKSNITKMSIDQLEKILKVISDSTRLKIIQLLSVDSLYGKEIADKLGFKAPTITHHINQLIDAELLHVEQIAQIKYYSLNHNKYDAFIKALKDFKNRL